MHLNHKLIQLPRVVWKVKKSCVKHDPLKAFVWQNSNSLFNPPRVHKHTPRSKWCNMTQHTTREKGLTQKKHTTTHSIKCFVAIGVRPLWVCIILAYAHKYFITNGTMNYFNVADKYNSHTESTTRPHLSPRFRFGAEEDKNNATRTDRNIHAYIASKTYADKKRLGITKSSNEMSFCGQHVVPCCLLELHSLLPNRGFPRLPIVPVKRPH